MSSNVAYKYAWDAWMHFVSQNALTVDSQTQTEKST